MNNRHIDNQLTTDDIPEGYCNLYFQQNRVESIIHLALHDLTILDFPIV